MSKKTAHRCCAAAIQRNFQARISSMYVDNFRRTIDEDLRRTEAKLWSTINRYPHHAAVRITHRAFDTKQLPRIVRPDRLSAAIR